MVYRLIIIAIFILFSLAPLKSEAQSFTFDPADTVTGCNGGCPGGTDIIIPSDNNGTPVTAVGSFAFSELGLTSVMIPESVMEVGYRAFWRNLLSSVSIPNKVTTIDRWAFASNQLTSVSIPHNVTNIGAYAFNDNQLVSVIISDSLTTIEAGVFSANKLTSVNIPNSVTTIGNSAFKYNQLTSVIIPNNVTVIGGSAFSSNQLTSVTIPDSVTTIYQSAFGSNQLPSVTIPDGVTTIGDYAFGFNQITSVIIPDSVTTIGVGAFSHNQLTSAIISNNVTTISDRVFERNQLTSLTLPNNLTTIGSKAFLSNQLTSVDFPSSLTAINDSAFAFNKLTSVAIPDNVTTISEHTFGNNLLSSVTLPSSLTTIGEYAFDFNQLKSVTIPSGVTTISSYAFSLNHLESVLFEGNRPALGVYSFDPVSTLSSTSTIKTINYLPNKTGWPGDDISGITPTLLASKAPPVTPPTAQSNFRISAHSDVIFVSLPQKATVFGINIYAASDVKTIKIQHVANVMAQYLDNDQDGVADQPNVLRTLQQRKSALVISNDNANVAELQVNMTADYYVQDLRADNINLDWHTNKTGAFDETLKKALQLISASGFAYTYPDIFSEEAGSLLANAMDKARGNWFTYDDQNCNYNCMVSNYFYWSLSSLLGAHENRESEISSQWQLNTVAKLRARDPDVVKLLTKDIFKLPKILPNGKYTADSVSKPNLDPGKLSGTWYDPSESGHGIMLQVFDRGSDELGLTMTWFTFDENRQQEWYYGDTQQIVASGTGGDSCHTSNGNYFATFPTLSRSGGSFVNNFDPASVSSKYWGAVSVCYEISADEVSLKYLNSAGEATKKMTRLTKLANTSGTNSDALAGLTGTWYDPKKSGQGLFLEMIERANNITGANLAWYGFRDQKPMYFLGSVDALPTSGNSLTVPIYETSGAKFGTDFNPSDVSRNNWGELHIERISCNKIKVRFEGNETDFTQDLDRLSSVSGKACR